MSFFRQFNKTICSSLLTKPNNLILSNSCTPVYLCSSNEPCIDHVNSIKSLVRTINKLQAHTKNTTYEKSVNKELDMLRNSLGFYLQSCLRYVQTGGRLTAQALANLYACADKLKVNQQWLKAYAQSQIPHLIRYMTVDNLKDLQEGLKKYNGSTEFGSLVQKQLKTRNQQAIKYVERAFNEVATFQQSNNATSNNCLLNAIESKSPVYKFYFQKFTNLQSELIGSYFKKSTTGYALD